MSKAYVIDKNMGHKMDVPVGFMPTHNADGRAVVPLTEEQKYLFDARGWLFIPGILNKVEVEEMRAYALRLHDNPESLPEHGRSFVAGPLEKLTDHPVVVGFLNKFLAFLHLSSPGCYGFRMDSSGLRAPSPPVREPIPTTSASTFSISTTAWGSHWSPWNLPEKLIEKMPPMRQTLFRGTYIANNVPGYQYHGQNMGDRQLAG